MVRILIILREKNGPRASSAPLLGLFSIIFKHVYWYIQQISGEHLQDHWSSGFMQSMLIHVNHSGLSLPMKSCSSQTLHTYKS